MKTEQQETLGLFLHRYDTVFGYDDDVLNIFHRR